MKKILFTLAALAAMLAPMAAFAMTVDPATVSGAVQKISFTCNEVGGYVLVFDPSGSAAKTGGGWVCGAGPITTSLYDMFGFFGPYPAGIYHIVESDTLGFYCGGLDYTDCLSYEHFVAEVPFTVPREILGNALRWSGDWSGGLIDSFTASVSDTFADPGVLAIVVAVIALPLLFWVIKKIRDLFPGRVVGKGYDSLNRPYDLRRRGRKIYRDYWEDTKR